MVNTSSSLKNLSRSKFGTIFFEEKKLANTCITEIHVHEWSGKKNNNYILLACECMFNIKQFVCTVIISKQSILS